MGHDLKVELRNGDTVQFQGFSVADLEALSGLNGSATEMATKIISQVSKDGSNTSPREWSKPDLIVAWKAFSKIYFKQSLDAEKFGDVAQQFVDAYKSYVSGMAEKIATALKTMTPSNEMFFGPEWGKTVANLQKLNVPNLATQNPFFAAKSLIQSFTPPKQPFADDIQKAVAAMTRLQETLQPYEELRKTIQAIPKAIVDVKAIQAFQKSEFFRTLTRLPDVDKFFRDLQQASKEMAEGRKVLRKHGFGHVIDILTNPEVRALKKKEKTEAATTAKRIISLTNSLEFQDELVEVLNGSSRGRRRAPIIKQALNAHKRKEYSVSIPTLTAQLEGLLTDLLGAARVYVWFKGQWVVRDTKKGLPKINKKGYPVVETLGSKIKRRELSQFPELASTVDFFLNVVLDSGLGKKKLSNTRNDIMHGQSLTYGKGKLSAQLLVTLATIAVVLEDFECKQSKRKLTTKRNSP